VLQFVSCDARAWHAGVSSFGGREQCNDFSVGIEVEGSDHVAFSPAQYESLAALTLALAARYPLAAVQGHEHVAPGRKTDPGPFFDWEMFAQSMATAAQKLPQNSAVLVPAHRLVSVVSAMENVKTLHQKK
jgi:AmpD protein